MESATLTVVCPEPSGPRCRNEASVADALADWPAPKMIPAIPHILKFLVILNAAALSWLAVLARLQRRIIDVRIDSTTCKQAVDDLAESCSEAAAFRLRKIVTRYYGHCEVSPAESDRHRPPPESEETGGNSGLVAIRRPDHGHFARNPTEPTKRTRLDIKLHVLTATHTPSREHCAASRRLCSQSDNHGSLSYEASLCSVRNNTR